MTKMESGRSMQRVTSIKISKDGGCAGIKTSSGQMNFIDYTDYKVRQNGHDNKRVNGQVSGIADRRKAQSDTLPNSTLKTEQMKNPRTLSDGDTNLVKSPGTPVKPFVISSALEHHGNAKDMIKNDDNASRKKESAIIESIEKGIGYKYAINDTANLKECSPLSSDNNSRAKSQFPTVSGQGDKKLTIPQSDKTKLKSITKQTSLKHVADTRNYMQAIFVRVLLACSSLLCVWRAADVDQNDMYWLLGLSNIILAVETIIILKLRRGKEPIWICPCFIIYLCGTVPSIWILQLDKIQRYSSYASDNSTSVALSTISGVTLPFALEPDTWVAVLQQSMLFILVIGRMFLPRGNLSREELSQLLFIFIGSGSDVVEFFVVFDEPEFRTNDALLYATLIIWSVSLLQFTLVLTSAKNPRKTRLFYADYGAGKSLFGIEILSLWVSIIFMDGPYLCLRLYAIISFNVLSYGIIFFTCKNVLMLMLLFYRMSIVCIKLNNREKRREKQTMLELCKI